MTFHHAPKVWNEHPELVAGVLHVQGVDATADVSAHVDRLSEVASARPETARVLIVAEAMHENAVRAVEALVVELGDAIEDTWPVGAERALLRGPGSRFESREGSRPW